MLKMDTPFVEDGITYLTTENYYQAMKIPDDRLDLREEIANMGSHESKRMIRTDRYPFREDWDAAMSLRVMEKVLRHKFALGTTWADKLLKTGEEEIVEWNNWNDLFWGKDIVTEEGKNHLGIILMKLRNELRLEEKLDQPPWKD
jgi:ribA/ribD-fused uncharacterized protein